MNRTPSRPPAIASRVICNKDGYKPQRNNAGSVKITPLATELEEEPTVCAMLASSMLAVPPIFLNAWKAATVITATGMDVLIVKPARKPRYAFAAPKRMPNKTPKNKALTVNSF